jgi:hypothetical protein
MTHARNNLIPWRIKAGAQEFTMHASSSDDAVRRFRDCKVVPASVAVVVSREPEEAPEVQVGRERR